MRQEMIELMALAVHNAAYNQRGDQSHRDDHLRGCEFAAEFRESATAAIDALLDALEAKQPILEAYELIEVLRGES